MMTEDELTEAFQLIRQHSSALVHPLIDSLERMYQLDRSLLELERVKTQMTEGIFGHRVYTDNDQHSRRADLRSA